MELVYRYHLFIYFITAPRQFLITLSNHIILLELIENVYCVSFRTEEDTRYPRNNIIFKLNRTQYAHKTIIYIYILNSIYVLTAYLPYVTYKRYLPETKAAS